jgi:hypothetical protein
MTQEFPRTVTGLIEATRAVLAERGDDYVYTSPLTGERGGQCFYWVPEDTMRTDVEEGAPSCLFGAAFAKMGLTEDITGNNDTVSSVLTELIHAGHVEEDIPLGHDFSGQPGVGFKLRDVQAIQDSGYEYAAVRQRFEGYFPAKG